MTYKNIKTAEEVEAWELQPLKELQPNVVEWGSPLAYTHVKPNQHTFGYIEAINGFKLNLYYDTWLVKFSDGTYSVYNHEHFKSKFRPATSQLAIDTCNHSMAAMAEIYSTYNEPNKKRATSEDY